MNDNNGKMVLIDNYGIGTYKGLFDALLDNGYTVTINKVGDCFYVNYEMASEEQTERSE